MKVLIIEDNKYKLEQVITVLKEHDIVDYVHFNNLQESVKFIRRGNIKDISFIVLDLFFYLYRPLLGENSMPSTVADARFLYRMLEENLKTPIVIFSSEDDFMTSVNSFFFPKLFEYSKNFQNGPLPLRLHQIEEKYYKDIEKNKELLSKLDFIIGHAHNNFELCHLISDFLKSETL